MNFLEDQDIENYLSCPQIDSMRYSKICGEFTLQKIKRVVKVKVSLKLVFKTEAFLQFVSFRPHWIFFSLIEARFGCSIYFKLGVVILTS